MRVAPRLLLGAAGGIALVTVAARVVGFGRTAVLSRTLGTSCVGDVYSAANAVPNVVFEVVAGGALAALVVPVLAAAVRDGDRATASRTASALLTWTVALLVPVAVLGALSAPALVRGLLSQDPTCAGAVETGSRLLVVFMPQVVLYGVGIVLAGVLQAHRRFLGPALAPLLSSVVVVGAYLLYAALGRVEDLAALTRSQELVLSVGTTLGVAVLSLGLLVPLRRCGLSLRPTLSFPAGVAATVRRLALGGVAALAAQQVALVVALRLAGTDDDSGSVVVLGLASALFLLPWAVLAVPVATSVFPTLASADEPGYRRALGTSLRAVLLAMTGAAAVLAVVAVPLARLLVDGAPGADRTASLAGAVVAFAPGLVGYGLVALLSRARYAVGDGRRPAVAAVVGWLVVATADLALVTGLPDADRVVLLGVGNTLGVTVAGVLLLLGVRRDVAGSGATRTALAGGLAAAVTALGALAPLPPPSPVTDLVAAAGLGLLASAVFLALARLLDPVGLRGLLRA